MKEARSKAHSQESTKLTQDNKYFECGVFLHVLGDTYAHTMDGDISYQPVIGHTADWTAPDNPQLNLDKFLRYLNDLISAFDEKKTSGMPIREVRDKLATWRYDFATKKWTIPEGAEYQQVIMDLFQGKFPNADIATLDKKIKMSNTKLDDIVKNSVLPQLRKCYRGAW